MSTGYTYKLVEEGQSLEDYAMSVARSLFWQCRDNSGPLPDKFELEPDLLESLLEAKKRLVKLNEMTTKQQLAYGNKVKKETIELNQEACRKINEENDILQKMKEKVIAWVVPPTLASLKEVMISQLVSNFDTSEYHKRAIDEAQRATPKSFWVAARDKARRDVRYHFNDLKESKAQLKQQNQFLKDLRKALA
jgi:hypothetical protein